MHWTKFRSWKTSGKLHDSIVSPCFGRPQQKQQGEKQAAMLFFDSSRGKQYTVQYWG